MKEFALALSCHDCIPLHVADEAAPRAGADHALGYEPVSERFVMVSVSLIGEADASFARFAPENAGSVWECAGSALITCPPYVCQMTVMCPALVRRLVSQPRRSQRCSDFGR